MMVGRIATELGETGLSVCRASDFLPDWPNLCEFAETFAASEPVRQARVAVARGERLQQIKQFLCKYRENACEPAKDILSQQLWNLLPIVREALGSRMQAYGSDLWYAIPVGDKPREWSQNWHRDPESRCVVKVMAYFWDVTQDSGPLEYVQRSYDGTIYGDVAISGNLYANEAAEKIKPEHVTTLVVPAGTLAFVCTTGLHRGGYCASKPRLSATWTFVRA